VALQKKVIIEQPAGVLTSSSLPVQNNEYWPMIRWMILGLASNSKHYVVYSAVMLDQF
jgi:hypothetical protein